MALCGGVFVQDLWQEVKAYTDILSEMHMLAFDNLEERFASGKDHRADGKPQSKAAATEPPSSSSSSSSGGAAAVPPLSLQGRQKKPLVGGAVADGKHFGTGKGSGNSSSGTGRHRDESKSVHTHHHQQQHQQQHQHNGALDSPGTPTARSSSSSSGGSSSKERGTGSSGGYGHMCGDAAEFVASIQHCLTIDRIGTVVDDIKAAFDTERAELMFKIKQLEATMEGDCDVISTNRSGGRSSKSSPRAEREAFPTGNQPPQPRGGGGGGRANHSSSSGSNSSFWDEDEDRRAGGKGRGGGFVQCTACGGDVGEYFPQDMDMLPAVGPLAAPGTASARQPTAAGTDICLDCRARSRREKKLLSRLPKAVLAAPTGATVPTHAEERGGSDGASGPAGNNVDKGGPSKFRNRLQAARDEHHFIEDNIFLS